MGILQKISKKGSEEGQAKKSANTAEAKKSAATEKEGKGKKAAEPKVQKQAKPEHGFAYRIILGPVLTEKGELLKAEGKYAFFIEGDANKVEVSRAIKALYGVDPVSVRVISLKGKRVRYGRLLGRRKNRKKAIVTLKPGDSISLAESV